MSQSKKDIHPIDSSFKWVDSVMIDYFSPATAAEYYITFNRNSIKVSSNYSKEKVITNRDTVEMIKKYVEALFISGKEKTEIGRSYKSNLVFTDYDQIRISLFVQGKLLVTHKIHIGMENYNVEFSDTFNKFYDLIYEFTQ